MATKRIWHGWTTQGNADIYQQLLHDEVEFVTIMTFDSLQNVIDFQGEDYKKCYVPDAAQQVLKHWDLESAHYETIEIIIYH